MQGKICQSFGCGKVANTVVDGRHVCPEHAQLDCGSITVAQSSQRCEVPGCTAPVARVMDGRNCCASHSHLHLNPAPPITVCALDGCGLPAITTGARPLCRTHAPRAA